MGVSYYIWYEERLGSAPGPSLLTAPRRHDRAPRDWLTFEPPATCLTAGDGAGRAESNGETEHEEALV